MLCTLEMSRLSKSADWRTCQTIDGTPPKVVMRSRSMSSRARSGFQRYIRTSLEPATIEPWRIEWQPVAWKNGTDKRLAVCAGAGGWPATGSFGGVRIADRAPAKASDMMFVVKLRWVPRAPLGRPVVPD